MKEDFKGKFPTYQAPEGFYDNLSERVMAEAKKRNKHARARKIAFAIGSAATLLIAVLLLSVQIEQPQEGSMLSQTNTPPAPDTLLAQSSPEEKKPSSPVVSSTVKSSSHNAIDQLIATMSDEELSSLYSSYQSDYFYYSYN